MSDRVQPVLRPSPRNIAWIVTATLAVAVLLCCVLVFIVFAGGREHLISAAILLSFAAGAALLAVASVGWSDQPQRWALKVAIGLGLTATVLLLWPGVVTTEAYAWVMPLLLLALVVWMATHVRRELYSRVRTWLVYPVLIGVALAAVAAGYESLQEWRKRVAHPAVGQLVDVGQGRGVYVSCIGSGSPVVVLAAGFAGGASTWGWIAPDLARDTRVCVFDRAGRGWSDPAPGPQDGSAVAQDLVAALAGAGETGPYVLAGHSFGGLYVRAFAAKYPERTAGMVLLDATDPLMFTRVPSYPRFYDLFRRASGLFPTLARFGVARLVNLHAFDSMPPEAAAESRRFGATARNARSLRDEFAEAPLAMQQAGALTTLGDRPLMIVTAMKEAQEGWAGLQDDLAKLSTNSSHWTLTTATHGSLVESQAEAAISSQAIREVVGAVRTATPLPRH